MKVKFGKTLQKEKIHEWYMMYVDYKSLKKRLKLLKRYSQQLIKIQVKFLKNQDEKYYILNYEQFDYDLIQQEENNFNIQISQEIQKIEDFYDFKYYDIFHKYEKIKEFIQIYEKQINWFGNDKEKIKILEKNKTKLIECIKNTYVESIYLKNYLDLNQKALKLLLKKYKSISKDFQKIGIEINEICLNKLIDRSIIKQQEPKQRLMILKLKKYYLQFFQTLHERENEKQNLKLLSQRKLLSLQQKYYLGIFISIIFWFIIFVLNGYLIIDTYELRSKISYVMPIFLFQFYILLYLWMLSLNVWSKYNVNYRYIFKFNHHYSRPNQILTRASILTTIWFSTVVLYLTSKSKIYYFYVAMYIFLFGYIFFPSKKMFNAQGRRFLFRLIKKVIFFCYYPSDFPINWFTDQMVSFIGPLKDLEYSICFLSYSSEYQSQIHKKCGGKPLFSLLAGIFPYSLRMIQCYSQMQQKKDYQGQDFFNFLKYFVSFLTLICSYIIIEWEQQNILITYLWIFLATFTALYSYYWDLKYDWGLLQDIKQKKYLRNDLMYISKNFYYSMIIINLIFRFVWIFNITNITQIQQFYFLDYDIDSIYLNFYFCLVEMLRRIIWNMFRVEKEHVINCGLLNAVPKTNFDKLIEHIPFKIQNQDQEKYQSQIYKKLLSNSPTKQQDLHDEEIQEIYNDSFDEESDNHHLQEFIQNKESEDILNDNYCTIIHKKKFQLVEHYIKNKPKSSGLSSKISEQLKKLAKEDYEFNIRSQENLKQNIQYKKSIYKYD